MQAPLVPIPALWDEVARERPDQVIASFPIGPEVRDGYVDVTAKAMADAINRASWYLERELGGRSSTFQTLCYLGPSDLRYPIIMSAAAKLGYKSFWTSPRNSLEAHVKLMESTDCTIFLTPATIPPGVPQLMERVQMRHIVIPEQKDWLGSCESVQPYPFTKTYEQCCHDPFTVIHTSGSTGIPKPIFIPHGFVCCPEAIVREPHPKGNISMWRWFSENPARLYTPFPMFHGAGLIVFHHYALLFNQIPVLPPPNKPVTPELSVEIIASGYATSAFLPPAIIEGIAKSPEFTEELKRLKFFIYGGAALPVEVGDRLRARTRIFNAYGQTETGLLHQYYVDDEDFAYVSFGPLSNMELQHHADDLYEAVMVKKPGLEQYQAGFLVEPQATEVRTRDLFARHPDPKKSDLWIHRGRADDVIVYETGEKMNPVSMESLISTHSAVQSALVIGEGRFQSALLIEPVQDIVTANDRVALLESIWPMIEAANNDAPAHGRVVKALVLFALPGIPFLRTAKESVRKKATLELYNDMINEAYATIDTALDDMSILIQPDSSKDTVLSQVRDIVRQTTRIEVADDESLYEHGIDSLQSLQLSRSLKAALQKVAVQLDVLTPRFVYANPTIRQLGESVYSLCHATANGVQPVKRTQELEAILDDCAAKVDEWWRSRPMAKVVILTGSTGSLGAYLLEALMHQTSVAHVYCLNRSADAKERQIAMNRQRGLSSSFDPARVTFLTCDFAKPLLGLDQAIYDRLLACVTHVIHNAWTVNFNLALSTYVPANLGGIMTLIKFAVDSCRRVQTFFVSSVGTVMGWKQSGHLGPVPEEPIDDPTVADDQGYAGSKWIAERLFYLAHKKYGVDVGILRVGQIAGPVGTTKGAWNRTEWFPAFLTTCKSLGLLPDRLEVFDAIDWLPVNVLADVVIDLVNRGLDNQASLVYNLVNPSTTTWGALCPGVQHDLSRATGKELRIVSYSEWLQALEGVESTITTADALQEYPAAKLIDFFRGLDGNHSGYELCTDHAQQNSPTLNKCGPVTQEWMSLWLKQLDLGV